MIFNYYAECFEAAILFYVTVIADDLHTWAQLHSFEAPFNMFRLRYHKSLSFAFTWYYL